MYKVHFRLKEEEYQLVAESLDLTHPYFVSIKDMILDYEEGMVVNPHLEATKKRFADISSIMIPLQNVLLIETLQPKAKPSPKPAPMNSNMRVVVLPNQDENDES